MTYNDFIFSNQTAYRITRHLVFWICYCFYFWVQSLAPRKLNEFYAGDTYYFAFLNLCSFAPVFIFAVYFFIYFLYPKTLQKKKYSRFVFGFILVYAAGTIINYFTAGIFLNHVHYSTPVIPDFQHKIEFGNYNTRWGMIIATVALGIKASKEWYLQQKENQLILRQKIRSKMQLHKARIHPELLFRSLDTIQANVECDSVNATSMILNLSDLLSYSLYESEMELVPLEKELFELQHLIALEQINKENTIEIDLKTEGDISNKYISPMVMIKLLEDSIILLQGSQTLSCLLKLNILVVGFHLSFTLSFINIPEQSSVTEWPLLVRNTKTRISELYPPDNFVIELIQEKVTAISLKLMLSNTSKESNAVSPMGFKTATYDVA